MWLWTACVQTGTEGASRCRCPPGKATGTVFRQRRGGSCRGRVALGSSLVERMGHEQASELPRGQKEGHVDCEPAETWMSCQERDTVASREALPRRSRFHMHPQCWVFSCLVISAGLVGSPTQKKTSPPLDSASRSLPRCPQIDGWSNPRSMEPLENVQGPELLQVWSLGWLLFLAAPGLHCHTRALSRLQRAGTLWPLGMGF